MAVLRDIRGINDRLDSKYLAFLSFFFHIIYTFFFQETFTTDFR